MLIPEWFYYVIVFLWVVSEYTLTYFRRRKKNNEKDPTTRTFLIVIYSSLIIAIILSYIPDDINPGKIPIESTQIQFIGGVIILFGMMLRWYAILVLGKLFTANITILENHVLCTNNIYKYIRHPSYLGAIISYAGFGIFLMNYISLVIIVVPVIAVNLFRINYEEQLLAMHFGKTYTDYIKRTKRFIPFVY